MPASPKRVTIRTYQVGFGDCFLLSFEYSGGKKKHVLIDYGSTGLPDAVPKKRMMDIALDIEAQVGQGNRLDVVVATHRHKDHISGFATKANGQGTGDVIRSLKPKLVIQPWTEDPKLDPNAKGPPLAPRGRSARRIRTLSNMQASAAQVLSEARGARFIRKELRAQLAFLGEDNLANLSAVKNLMTMGPNNYVFHGKAAGLSRILPGVTVEVLGPPTVEQTDTIKVQRQKDSDEFWHMRAAASADRDNGAAGRLALFPRHVRSRGPRFPLNTRWLVYHARQIRGEQLLQIVRMLDDAMNNTSVVLLFAVKKKSLLFPGDAQIENWKFALSKTAIKDRLAKVDVYKVGHHGSLNATPKTLWGLFANRAAGTPKKLTTLMSTLEDKHGSEDKNTEVPRRALVTALQAESDFFSTQMLTGGKFFHETVVDF
jgi:hypothetical protein